MSRELKDGNGPGQPVLMPADPAEWLSAGHLARRVPELDLPASGTRYRADGQAPGP